mgnify:CR=1 FL=1
MILSFGSYNHYYIRHKRKEVDILSQPCICIDVSKNTSHVQGFINSIKTPVSKPFKIYHTITGFNKIKDLYIKLVNLTNSKPLVIFESTGVYHKCLVQFLEQEKYDYHAVSPLKSAKHRNSEIRNAKTDKRDCKNLADMFYSEKLGIFYKHDSLYTNLKNLNREYHTNKIHLQKLEVTLNELIDTIFPCFDNLFSNLLSKSSLDFLEKFYHPDLINNSSLEDITNFFLNSDIKHSESYSKSKASTLKNYASNIISGCSINSYITLFLLDTIKQLKLLLEIQNNIISKIIELAKQTPYFTIIRSIPGIGDLICARLIAEIGDISRFKKPEQINAFIGVDPIIDQSGIKDGKHLHISKKGNKIARSIFFLIVRSMVRKKVKDNQIKQYYSKKKAQPNIVPKVALFACVNKFIRMIHSLCKNGLIYEYSITQK